MHNLVHLLVRNAKLACEFGLRDARSVPGANDGVAFASSESGIRRRGIGVEPFEDATYGGMDCTQDTNVLGPNSPYGAQDSTQ